MPNLRFSYLVATCVSSFVLSSIGVNPVAARESNINVPNIQAGLGLDIGLDDSLLKLTGSRVAVNQAPISEPNSKQPLGLGVTEIGRAHV